ncbi:MAG: 4'-phosphopantetheinyl transferase superfamily protein [Bacteroidia bacterium]
MALVEIRELKPANYLGVWKIEESEQFFNENLWLDDEEKQFLASINAPGRRLQWLASRLLIRKIINPAGQILMEWDSFGKPIIINYDFEVSISHCTDMVAVIVGDSKSGIDIEKQDRKVERIAKKFVREDEYAFVEDSICTDYYITFWAAKETMFKYYGGGGIDFKEHMKLYPFKMGEKGHFEMEYMKGRSELLKIYYEWVDGHILTYCL